MRRGLRIVLLVCAALVLVLVLAYPRIATAFRNVNKPVSHTSQWQWLHGREAVRDLATCRKCHDAYSCSACHLASWPHPASWQQRHGAQAAKTDSRGCTLCHRENFCDPCHGGLTMPHPPSFIVSHANSGSDDAVCVTCHDTRDCAACHLQHRLHTSGGLVFE